MINLKLVCKNYCDSWAYVYPRGVAQREQYPYKYCKFCGASLISNDEVAKGLFYEKFLSILPAIARSGDVDIDVDIDIPNKDELVDKFWKDFDIRLRKKEKAYQRKRHDQISNSSIKV